MYVDIKCGPLNSYPVKVLSKATIAGNARLPSDKISGTVNNL